MKTIDTHKWKGSFLILLIFSGFTLASQIIYVDDDAFGSNDGSSWENAYIYLQDALSFAAVMVDANGIEIRVAQGTYKPDMGAGITAGDREASFVLINDVTLSGGYAGIFEPDPDERDYDKYETILSGDLAGNDIDVHDVINQLWGLQDEPTWAENSYHVIKSIETDSSAILKGFTITSGHANGNSRLFIRGAGMYNENSESIINNCKFVGNAGLYGAGLYNSYKSQPFISETSFEDNIAYTYFYGDQSYGGYGGGMYNVYSNPIIDNCIFRCNINSAVYNYNKSNVVITNCVFIKNNSEDDGGAIKNYSSNMTINNCSFINNKARYGGGAIANSDNIDNRDTILNFKHCIFSGNTSMNSSGGVICSDCSIQTFENCIFVGNRSESHGSVIYGISTFIIQNSIFLSNYSQGGSEIYLLKIQPDEGPSSVTISYSNIKYDSETIYIGEGSFLDWKEGNIVTDPCFVDPGYWDANGTFEDVNDDFWVDGDYHLKSQAGRWNPVSESWIQDDVTSLCIDTGDPYSPIGYEPFPNGGYINMGAYGGTSEASKSYFGKPVCETIIAGDINGDCIVDIKDFEIMILHWLEAY